MNWRRLGALAGMVGPVVFVTTFMLAGWLRPGYEPLRMFVSELAIGPRGWIQILDFLVYGVLFLVFARGVAVEFSTGKASRTGPIFLTIIGIGTLAAGVFVTDPATTSPRDWSWHGLLHVLFSLLVFSLWPVTCFVFLRRFREDPRWRPLALLTGIITATVLIIMTVGPAQPPAPPNAVNALAGLIQRTGAIVFSGWQFAVALRLYSRSRSAVGQDAEHTSSAGGRPNAGAGSMSGRSGLRATRRPDALWCVGGSTLHAPEAEAVGRPRGRGARDGPRDWRQPRALSGRGLLDRACAQRLPARADPAESVQTRPYRTGTGWSRGADRAFPDQSVDAVVGTLVLCSVDDQAGIRRVLEPAGRYAFVEHVAAPIGTWTRRAQEIWTPISRHCRGGCNPDRETWRAIERVGLSAVDYVRFELPAPFGFAVPHIAGMALK